MLALTLSEITGLVMGQNPKQSSISLAAQKLAARPTRRSRSGHGRSTLADVAAAAGLSPMTVSRYLREPSLVAAGSGARIAQALKRVGYIANKQAGTLASGAPTGKGRKGSATRLVAAIIPSIAHSIFSETVQALSDGLQAQGFELLLACTNYQLEREAQQIAALLAWSPAALVLTGRKHSAQAQRLLRGASERGLPIVEMWDLDKSPRGFTQVGFNHQQLGMEMARGLLARGWQRLAYVDSSVPEDFRAHERASGFVQACERAGQRVQLLRGHAGEPMQAGRDALLALAANNKNAQLQGLAIAFANDHLAAGALLQAQSMGLAVPGELGLLGFGDFPIARQLGTGLSTVQVPRYEIGQLAAQTLLSMLSANAQPNSPSGSALRLATPPQLLFRGSC
jgi:LacI family transcriptional regulator, gluconate utilization system Gnt-I transcriptional repressor